jgi:predicted CXXCH cytochrome family protein
MPNNTDVVNLQQVLTSPTITVANGLPGALAEDFYVGNIRIPAGTTLASLGGANVQGLSKTGDISGLDANGPDSTATGSTAVGPTAGGRWTNLLEQYGQPYGAHGGYSNTTDRCKVCHDVHAAAGSKRLTAGNTAEDICETCHDFTQGISIYGAIEEATGVRPEGGHRIQNLWGGDQTTDTASISAGNPYGVNSGTVIPGYMPGWTNEAGQNYPQTGGVYAYTSGSLASRENQLTCTDCHTPHGNTSMRPFKGDRVRLGTSIIVAATLIQPLHVNTVDLTPATLAAVTAAVTADPGRLMHTGGTALQFATNVVPTLPVSASGGREFPMNISTAGYLVDVLQILGEVPAGNALPVSADFFYDADGNPNTFQLNDGLKISQATAVGRKYAQLGVTHIPWSGVALAVALRCVGAVDVDFDLDGLTAATLTRMPSNKLLRDYVNQLDLRSARYGGTPLTVAPITADYNNYDETIQAQLIGSAADVNGDQNALTGLDGGGSWAGNPYNQGQMGAKAEYGSGFCAACHRGRIGNYVGLVNSTSAASQTQARLDIDFANIELPQNAIAGSFTAGAGIPVNYVTYPSMTDSDTCLNHPTLMKLPYRNVGPMTGSYGQTGTNGDPGDYNAPLTNGLALSNQGFAFWPAKAGTIHPDGRLGGTTPLPEASRPNAPICQQCHEDSRDIESSFQYAGATGVSVPQAAFPQRGVGDTTATIGDTDKDVPFATPVNTALNAVTAGLTGNMNFADEAQNSFIYGGNPLFQNFPHETQNYRLLVEGGDSNKQGGGNNDDLCLNCHVPGSTVRAGMPDQPIIFTTLVKDFNGFQE